jgi:hypothetical protein
VSTFPIGGNCVYFAWFNALKFRYGSNITPILGHRV